MSLQQVSLSIAKGCFDSLKGFYLVGFLDYVQRRAHTERGQFQELRRKPSPIHTHSATKEEPRLLYRVLQCSGLNGVFFFFSVVVFQHILLPLTQIFLSTVFGADPGPKWIWFQLVLQYTFDTFWVIPLFVMSRVVNALWFQDVSNLAYRYSVGRPKGMSSVSTIIADNLFSFIIQLLFLCQALLCSNIPLYIVADCLYIFHMCLLYSLYSFEYKWVQMGWPIHQRLSFLETHWPYFLGFGLPLTLLTWYPGDIFRSGFLFSVFFPIFIVSGNEAEPVHNTSSRRLQLFSAVVYISNYFFSMISPFASPSSASTSAASRDPRLHRPQQPHASQQHPQHHHQSQNQGQFSGRFRK